MVIRFLTVFDTFIPYFRQKCIFRTEGTEISDLSDSSSTMIEDKQPPAAIVAADLRAYQVYSTTGLFTAGLVTENRAGMGMCIKNVRIQKKVLLVGINADGGFLTCIIVADQKTKIATIIPYDAD